MEQFSLDKKGYNIQEVNDFLLNNKLENDKLLSQKQERIDELKKENLELRQKLEIYAEKENSISKALTVATKKAEEIENNSKKIYEIEIERVRALYKKWENFFASMLEKYPKLSTFDKDKILDNFNDEINRILKQNNETTTADAKQNFMTLLSKMREYNQNVSAKINNKERVVIERNDKKIKEIEPLEDEDEQPASVIKNNQIKPIFDLDYSEEEDFDDLIDKIISDGKIDNRAKGYEKSILNTKPKVDNAKYPTPNESGFDFEKALNPTDDLFDIMKGFKLD